MKGKCAIRFFNFLALKMAEKGVPAEVEVETPEHGRTARSIASEFGVPEHMVEAVFINGAVKSMDAIVCPGDRAAFVPPGMPGPYRVLLGIRDLEDKKQD